MKSRVIGFLCTIGLMGGLVWMGNTDKTQAVSLNDEETHSEDKVTLAQNTGLEIDNLQYGFLLVSEGMKLPENTKEIKEQQPNAVLATAQDTIEQQDAEEPEGIEEEYANLAFANVTNYVNIRKEPNTGSEVLGKIYAGAVAEVLEVAGEDEEWFHIVSGDVEGYIKSEYFYYGQEAVEHLDEFVSYYATVKADRLNVRKEQNVDSKRIGYIDYGEKVLILEDLGEWKKVAYTEDNWGYVSSEYVTVSQEFTYGISIEEERRIEAERKALLEREKESEQAKPEKKEITVQVPTTTVYTSNEELRKSIVEYAKQYLGYKYVHGGKSLESGTDCSGFTCYIYAVYGYGISRTPGGQYTGDGRSISYSEIQPGDIVCYGDSKCTHVALYIGEGQIIHAANSKKGVIISNVDYMSNILGYKNVID